MKKIELEILTKKYVQAWCSGNPEKVASFFAPQGSSSDNGEPAAVGREAIAQSIGKLMLAFPDMVVTLDNLLIQSDNVEFHWTLSGTNTGPNGTGNKVKIKGVDFWKIDDDGLIQESQGSFDVEEFKRQIEQGC
ncbi:MAG: nuclear transport factor 2 family protein [Ignavibacteriales bacterium]|nr:nuclear transport factor 2 family protein [Ignavibacteriales bacterium]